MTRIEIAPDLLEEASFLAMSRDSNRGDPRAIEWLERRGRIYELPHGPARERAFREHALSTFRTRHMGDAMGLALEACPSAARVVDALFVRLARRAKDEGSELYCAPASAGQEPATRVVLTLRPERFLESEALHEFVHRELLYVDDMLDPDFGYDRSTVDRLPFDPGRRDVVRERVSRAWHARIEARARGESPTQSFGEMVRVAVGALNDSTAMELEG